MKNFMAFLNNVSEVETELDGIEVIKEYEKREANDEIESFSLKEVKKISSI